MDDCARQIDPEKHRIHSISKLRSVLYQASWRLNKSKETELAHVPAIWSNSPDWLSPGYGQTAQTHLRLACNRNRFIWLIPFSADQPRPSSQPRYLPFYLHLSFRSFFQRILKYPVFYLASQCFASPRNSHPLYYKRTIPLPFPFHRIRLWKLIDIDSI